jgi:HPt (histidine-containing phosphotransfer) domain-containing protein
MNLKYLEEVSAGDPNFKKELIEIFLRQVPEFVSNMKKFYAEKDWPNLAKEAHTAKSSALIFGMEETGRALKDIQLLAEDKKTEELPVLIDKSIVELEEACVSLVELAQDL